GFNRVAQRLPNVLLADQLIEAARAVAAGDDDIAAVGGGAARSGVWHLSAAPGCRVATQRCPSFCHGLHSEAPGAGSAASSEDRVIGAIGHGGGVLRVFRSLAEHSLPAKLPAGGGPHTKVPRLWLLQLRP